MFKKSIRFFPFGKVRMLFYWADYVNGLIFAEREYLISLKCGHLAVFLQNRGSSFRLTSKSAFCSTLAHPRSASRASSQLANFNSKLTSPFTAAPTTEKASSPPSFRILESSQSQSFLPAEPEAYPSRKNR